MSAKEETYASSAFTSIHLPWIGTRALDDTESELSLSLAISAICQPRYGDVVDTAILPDLKLDQALKPHEAAAGLVEQEAAPSTLHDGQTKKGNARLTSNNLQHFNSLGEPLSPCSAQLQRWLTEPRSEEPWSSTATVSTEAAGNISSKKTGSSSWE